MNEKTLIWGEKHKSLYIFFGVAVFSGILSFGTLLFGIQVYGLSRVDLDVFDWLILLSLLLLLLTVFFSICYKLLLNSEIVVTNKRIYGITAFKKRFDLPLDSVTSVEVDFLHGINVATSHAKLHFKCLKNNIEIRNIISKLLVERQKVKESKDNSNIQNSSNADELKKFKELLDNGTITQNEFDEKKKQLLGL